MRPLAFLLASNRSVLVFAGVRTVRMYVTLDVLGYRSVVLVVVLYLDWRMFSLLSRKLLVRWE